MNLVLPNSWISPKKNSPKLILVMKNKPLKPSEFTLKTSSLVLKLIGEKPVTLVQLKIKVHAVHVGHSQLLELLKDYQKPKVNYKTSLNNNSLIVQNHTETTDVTVVL